MVWCVRLTGGMSDGVSDWGFFQMVWCVRLTGGLSDGVSDWLGVCHMVCQTGWGFVR